MSFAFRRVTAAAAVSIVFVTSASHAAAPTASPDTVVVTATRVPTAADQVLAPIIVIDHDEIERSLPTDLADVLRTHAGIELGRNGGIGQTTSIFMRGSNSNHTLVLLDGVRINPGTIGVPAIQNIPPELVDHIEVVKGPLSTLYGTDAIGGVINVITSAPKDSGIYGSAGAGRYDTRAFSLTGSLVGDLGGASLSASRTDSDGFPPRTVDPRGGDYDNTSFNLNGSTNLGGLNLSLRAFRASGSVDYIGFSSRDFGNALTTQDYLDSAVAVAADYNVFDYWNTRLTLSRITDYIDQGRVHDSVDAAGYESSDFAHTRRYALDWQNDLKVNSNQTVTVGALLTRENTEASSSGTGYDIDTDVKMFYAQDQLHYGAHSGVLAVGYTDHETFGNKTTWNAQYAYDFPTATRIVGSYGTAFHAPDSEARFGFGGNPDLRPESSRNLEIDLRQAIGKTQHVWLSAFRNDVDNLIQFVVTDFVTFSGQNFNVARSRIEGLELGYALDTRDWHARVEAVFQDPKDRTTGEQLLRRARHNFTGEVSRRFAAFELGMEALAAGKREDFGGVQLDSYVVANLTARYFLTPHWTLQARLDNAFDKQYQLANTYNTAGRSLFVAVRYAPASP